MKKLLKGTALRQVNDLEFRRVVSGPAFAANSQKHQNRIDEKLQERSFRRSRSVSPAAAEAAPR